MGRGRKKRRKRTHVGKSEKGGDRGVSDEKGDEALAGVKRVGRKAFGETGGKGRKKKS